MKTKALALPKLSKKAKRNMQIASGIGIIGIGGSDLIRLAMNRELRSKAKESITCLIALMIGTLLLVG